MSNLWYNNTMDWSYISGYFDGEGSLLLGVSQDTRKGKIGNSQVDGWIIIPAWSLTSFDYETLNRIHSFLGEQRFSPRTTNLRVQRIGQSKPAMRIEVGGWGQIDKLVRILIPFSIAKRRQYELFLELHSIIECKGRHWTKLLFLKAMRKV
ncbi:hypothetical protein LCGC14_1969420, partial [marine sediment metagenome]